MEEKTKRIIEWNNGNKKSPTQVQIHLTDFCNLKCIFCPTRTLIDSSSLKRENELKTEKWLELIEEGEKLGVQEWHICGGGEPLLNKDSTLQIMKKIKETGCLGEIITNGTIFDNELAGELVKIKWDKITISLDSDKTEIHDEIRGSKGCFEKAVEFASLINKAKNKHKSEKPIVCFHMVVCNKNYTSVSGIIKLASKLGVNEVLVNALNFWSDKIKELELTKEQIKEFKNELLKARNIADKLGVDTNIDSFLNSDMFESANIMHKVHVKDAEALEEKKQCMSGLAKAACFSPWFNMSIFADGKTQPCFLLQEECDSVNDKDLQEVWFSQYFEKKRKDLLEHQLNEDCSKCNPMSLEINRRIRKQLVKEERN